MAPNKYGWRAKLREKEKEPGYVEEWAQRDQDARDKSATYESMCISTRRRHDAIKADFEDWVCEKYGWESGEDVWSAAELEECILDYLHRRTVLTEAAGRRRGQPTIAHRTLEAWKQSFVYWVAAVVPDGVQWLLAGMFYVRLYRHTSWIIKQYDLERHIGDRDYIGRYEVKLMIENVIATSTDAEYTLQLIVLILIFFLSGVRPGACGWTYTEFRAQGKYLKLKSIRIFREKNGAYAFTVLIVFEHLKGYNNIVAKKIRMVIRAVRISQNVVFDFGTALMCLLILRGAVRFKSLEEAMKDRTFEILIRPEMKDEPLFYKGRVGGRGLEKGEPASALALSELFKKAAGEVGLKRMTPYGTRRDCLDDIYAEYGEDNAQQAAGHGKNNVLRSTYSRGTKRLDMTGARVGEAIVGAAELNMHDMVALRPGAGLAPEALEVLQGLAGSDRLVRGLTTSRPGRNRVPRDSDVEAQVEVQLAEYKKTDAKYLQLQIDAQNARAHIETLLGEPIQGHGSGRIPLDKRLNDVPGGSAALAAHASARDALSSAARTAARSFRRRIKHDALGKGGDASDESEGQTVEDREAQLAELQRPSAALQAAIIRKEGRAPAETLAGSSRVPVNDGGLEDGGNVAGEDIPVDAEARYFDDEPVFDDRKELDVSGMDVHFTREAYAELLMNCTKERVPHGIPEPGRTKSGRSNTQYACRPCSTDPTVDEEYRGKRYQPWGLARHVDNFHTSHEFAMRYFRRGDLYNSTKATHECVLCINAGKPHRRWENFDAFCKHLRRHHSDVRQGCRVAGSANPALSHLHIFQQMGLRDRFTMEEVFTDIQCTPLNVGRTSVTLEDVRGNGHVGDVLSGLSCSLADVLL